MKTPVPTLLRTGLFLALMLPTLLPAVGPSFSEDFEGTLNQWTGKGGGSHSGQTVLDPLASGQGAVLRFNSLSSGGDLFASTAILVSGPIEVGFDYLGLPSMGGTPDDLGGFLGIAYSLTAATDGVDLFWYAGTQTYPGLLVNLVDDGAWHHYTFQLNASAIPPFHLIMEDFSGSGGVPMDAFFDNITVTMVPEPTIAGLTLLGLLLAFRRRA
jgi:hypothetical protein